MTTASPTSVATSAGRSGSSWSTRRARISPAQAGLPTYGGDRRRVSGLRREEVASWPGISSEHYTWLERGNATGVSDSVIDAIAHALQLDEAERTHLLDLLRTAGIDLSAAPPPGPPARPAHRAARPGLDGRHTRVRAQRAPGYPGRQPARAGAVLAGLRRPGQAANTARFVFLDSHATEFFGDWDKVANDTVALLRAEAGRNPYDRQLSDLIGELSTRSEEFRVRWAAHHVRIHTTGTKRFHHPVVGDLELAFELPAGRRPQPEPHPHRRTRIALPGRPAPAGQLGRDHPRHRTACGYRRPRAG